MGTETGIDTVLRLGGRNPLLPFQLLAIKEQVVGVDAMQTRL
jgi:hypothetical protein